MGKRGAWGGALERGSKRGMESFSYRAFYN